ncbi:hypothetical protein [Polyangium spumosum]|uniref:Uncharacterized protein n=1 Tax=Polyangium spumosum TaxID=889282 RepID=A0A6N7Q7G4_9BACT|nr:hypothetical protein [Polyangium spumosum]MRG98234.1 hypothetical protein [Polyangium spumosum]
MPKKPRAAAAPISNDAAVAPPSNHPQGGDASVQKILDTTPKVFRLYHNASGLSAVLFGYIREQELFKQAGCKDMEEYAQQHLGVESTPMYKKVARASKAGWKYYREHFERSVQRIVAGHDPLAEENAKLPSMTALALLSTALKSVPEDKRDQFLAGVLTGKIRAEDMAKRDRAATKSSDRPPATRAFEAMRAAEESLRECSKGVLSAEEREHLHRQAKALADLAADLLTRLAAE